MGIFPFTMFNFIFYIVYIYKSDKGRTESILEATNATLSELKTMVAVHESEITHINERIKHLQ